MKLQVMIGFIGGNWGIVVAVLVLAIALLTIAYSVFKVITVRPVDNDVHFKRFDPLEGEENLKWISQRLQLDNRGPPWEEKFVCPECSGMENFDPEIKFKESGSCSTCGNELIPFWNEDRTRIYLEKAKSHEDFFAIGGFYAGSLVAVMWGYRRKVGVDTFFIDVVNVEPTFRRGHARTWVHDLVFWMHLKTRGKLFKKFKEKKRFPVFGRIFLEYILLAKEKKYEYISTRTNGQQKYLIKRLKLVGFEFFGRDPEAPDMRVFFRGKRPM